MKSIWSVLIFMTYCQSFQKIDSKMFEKQSNGIPLVLNTWAFTNATKAAWRILKLTNDPLLAVEGGCSECESERCDGTVGYGGSPDENGESTLDALIMDGPSHQAGSVAGLRRVKNAIGVARAVMDYTKHTLLVGDLATQFAIEMGFQQSDLHSVESMRKWIDWFERNCQPNFRKNVSPESGCGPYRPLKDESLLKKFRNVAKKETDLTWHDTIGMIAINSAGNIAVGTSSNGATFKVPGRVGDAPIIGSGAYVDNDVGAAAATGDGDIMMRFLPSYQAVESMRNGMEPSEAARDAIQRIVKKHPDFIGALVAANKNGDFGAACHGITRFPFSVANDQSGAAKVFEIDCI